MPLSDIQPPATKCVLTGWGSPLIYAPDRCHLAQVGPMDPIRWVMRFNGIHMMGIEPLIRIATIQGTKWIENERYSSSAKLPRVTPSIASVHTANIYI